MRHPPRKGVTLTDEQIADASRRAAETIAELDKARRISPAILSQPLDAALRIKRSENGFLPSVADLELANTLLRIVKNTGMAVWQIEAIERAASILATAKPASDDTPIGFISDYALRCLRGNATATISPKGMREEDETISMLAKKYLLTGAPISLIEIPSLTCGMTALTSSTNSGPDCA